MQWSSVSTKLNDRLLSALALSLLLRYSSMRKLERLKLKIAFAQVARSLARSVGRSSGHLAKKKKESGPHPRRTSFPLRSRFAFSALSAFRSNRIPDWDRPSRVARALSSKRRFHATLPPSKLPRLSGLSRSPARSEGVLLEAASPLPSCHESYAIRVSSRHRFACYKFSFPPRPSPTASLELFRPLSSTQLFVTLSVRFSSRDTTSAFPVRELQSTHSVSQ